MVKPVKPNRRQPSQRAGWEGPAGR